MANSFDFNLVANDQVSAVIASIDEAVKKLQLPLDKTKDSLNLGGDETVSNINKVNEQFDLLAKLARDNVQSIGDIVPPLKMVGELGAKYAGILGKIGVAGTVAAGVGGAAVAAAKGLNQAADSAYKLDVASKNAGMRVDQFTRMAGVMRILGAEADSANQSVEGLYKIFNDALQGRNPETMALLVKNGIKIETSKDGTADVYRTLANAARVFPTLPSQNQKTLADAIGFDSNILMLLREGARYAELLSQSDALGLTKDPKLNDQLNELNSSIRELDAAWQGLTQRALDGASDVSIRYLGLKDILEGYTDLLTYGPDAITMSQAGWSGKQTSREEATHLRRAANDKEFIKSLPLIDQIAVINGKMSDSLNKKYQSYYAPVDAANRFKQDIDAITSVNPNSTVSGSNSVNANARSVRNNNPWNLNYARQRGASIEGGVSDPRFARFPTPEAGVLAADNQLKLYASGASKNVPYPLDSIDEIIKIASPRSDNNDTDGMIRRASEELNVKPNQSLDLSDPVMRSKVLAALFNQEGNNRHSSEQILGIIQGAPNINAPIRPASAEVESQRLAGAPEGRTEIELTIVNDRTGERQQYRAQNGGRITAPLQFP
ncbi:hypothetical protein ABRP57_09715 [Pectobacterium aroidearum]|uniref:hypothetical protein n=1 Tax=Pectobacterium aroidearum TaxID=1201031 RepID=UPI0032EDDEEE